MNIFDSLTSWINDSPLAQDLNTAYFKYAVACRYPEYADEDLRDRLFAEYRRLADEYMTLMKTLRGGTAVFTAAAFLHDALRPSNSPAFRPRLAL
jgi:hypothetical protein